MKKGIHKYKDGVVVRWHNRQTVVQEIEDKKGVAISFVRKTEPGETEEDIPCQSEIIRGRIRVTRIQLTRESAEYLFDALYYLLKK